MSQSYDLSIHVPVYNREETIEKCINSIINQTFQKFDLYIHDDCSTDNTLNILKKMNKDKKFKIISNPYNLGLYGNFNNILEKVNTRYFAIFHSDEEYNKDIISEEYFFLKNQDVSVVFSNGYFDIGNLKKQVIPNSVFRTGKNIYNFNEVFNLTLKYFNFFICSTAMFKRDIISKVGNFDEKFGMSLDLDMWFRLLEIKPVGIINKNLVVQNLKTSASYVEFKKDTPNDFFLVIDKIIKEKYNNKLNREQYINYKILKMRDNSRILFHLFKNNEFLKLKQNLKKIDFFFTIKYFYFSRKCIVILLTYISIFLFLKFKIIKLPKILLEYIYNRVS